MGATEQTHLEQEQPLPSLTDSLSEAHVADKDKMITTFEAVINKLKGATTYSQVAQVLTDSEAEPVQDDKGLVNTISNLLLSQAVGQGEGDE